MKEYKVKSGTVKAVQYVEHGEDKIVDFVGNLATDKRIVNDSCILQVRTYMGWQRIYPGEWVIMLVNGRINVMADQHFKDTYDSIQG